jgi:hypothetical protein
MSRAPLTCEALEPVGCGTPDCGHDHSVLFLHAQCHPSGKLAVAYFKARCVIRVTCARCDELVAEIAVAGTGRPN